MWKGTNSRTMFLPTQTRVLVNGRHTQPVDRTCQRRYMQPRKVLRKVNRQKCRVNVFQKRPLQLHLSETLRHKTQTLAELNV